MLTTRCDEKMGLCAFPVMPSCHNTLTPCPPNPVPNRSHLLAIDQVED